MSHPVGAPASLPFTPTHPSQSTYRRPSPLIGSSPPDQPDASPFPPGQTFPLADESGASMDLIMTDPYESATEYPFPVLPVPPPPITPGGLAQSYSGLALVTPLNQTTKLRGDAAISPSISIIPLPLAPSPPRRQSAHQELAAAVISGRGRDLSPKDYGTIHEINDVDYRHHQAFCNQLGIVPRSALDLRYQTTPPGAVAVPVEKQRSKEKRGDGFKSANVLFSPVDTLSLRLRHSPALGPLPVSPGTLPFRQPSWGASPFTPGQSQGASVLATPNTGPSPGYRFPPLPPVTPEHAAQHHGNAVFKMPPEAPDLFTPGYTMGPPAGGNSLDLDLGDMEEYINYPSSPVEPPPKPTLVPPAHRPIMDQLFPEESSVIRPGSPPKSNIAADALANHPLPADFSRRYTLLDEIGAGGFGFVCSAVQTGVDNEEGVEVAVKFMLKDNMPRARATYTEGLPTEVWVLRRCLHPSIIGFVDFYEDYKFFIIVMELHGNSWVPGSESIESPTALESPGMLSPFSASPIPARRSSEVTPPVERPFLGRRASYDLFEAVEVVRFSENQAKWIFKQIVDGIAYMHRRGFYHRDLKDENIVIDRDFTVKIIDFGSASYEDPAHPPQLHHHFRGTHSYASPEIHRGQGFYSGPCDIWSLGIILSILLTGQPPFPNREAAMQGAINLKSVVSRSAFALLKGCLRVDVWSRWTIEDILQNAWLSGVGPEVLERRMTPRLRPANPSIAPKKAGAMKGKKLW